MIYIINIELGSTLKCKLIKTTDTDGRVQLSAVNSFIVFPAQKMQNLVFSIDVIGSIKICTYVNIYLLVP